MWCLIYVGGELDMATTPALDTQVDVAADAPASLQTSSLIIDMHAVTFVDCSALRSLARARKIFAGRLWLRNPAPCVTHLLALSGMTGSLPVWSLLDGADGLTHETLPSRQWAPRSAASVGGASIS